jgi:hypothetical protein
MFLFFSSVKVRVRHKVSCVVRFKSDFKKINCRRNYDFVLAVTSDDAKSVIADNFSPATIVR